MLKLYKKSELSFSLLCIGIYCIAMSVADNISDSIDKKSVISLSVIAILSLIFASLFIVVLYLTYSAVISFINKKYKQGS